MARSSRLIAIIAGALACSTAAPALANSSAAEYFRNRANSTTVPELLNQSDRDWYRSLFAAMDAKDWTRVDTMFAERPDGPLHQVAKAEYFLDAASPKIELPAIESWLAQGTHLPQASKVASLGLKRGLTAMPGLPAEQRLVPQGYAPRRVLPSAVNDGTMPETVKSAIIDRIKNDGGSL